jgi:sulfide dehydrogenase cytochrome subunit
MVQQGGFAVRTAFGLLAAATIVGAGLGVATPAVSQQARASQQATGETLMAPCSACHGADGNSPGAIPALDGLEPAAIGEMLRAFRSGSVEGTVMNRIARGYTDAEIDAMVAYLGTLGR